MAQETSNFYRGLRRLFSNNVIVRYVGKKKVKVVDADGFQMRHGESGKYSRMKTYAKLEEASGAIQGSIDHQMLYNDYMQMDRDPILSSALDLYAEESTTRDEFEDILSITTDNKNIEDILQNLFYDILNIPFNLWGWIRNMAKFGDCYLYLELHKDLGIINIKILSPYEVERLEGVDEDNPYLVQFVIAGDKKDMLEEFQVAHFRLLGDVFHFPYGRSMLEGGRKIWQQLTLMEDAMLIHRITRAPEKRIIKIDVGALAPDEIDDHMENIMNGMRRTPFIDQATGEYNLKYNMMNINEDFFFPVRGGDTGTEIDTLSGMEYAIIDDIEYLQRKLFASLRIPKAFLTFEEGIGCVVPETEIKLINDEVKTVKELIEDYEGGIKNYVYSINEEKEIVPGEISWAGYTKKNANLVRVNLDNSKYIDCTPDHEFLTRNGEWVEAQNLIENQSLMPLYLDKTKYGYTTVYQPNTGKYKEVHRLVPEHYGNVIKGSDMAIHHCDFNKKNNIAWPKFIRNKNIKNHKVISIEFLNEQRDTCDITIEKYHNFATNAGVIIHNSKATLAAEDLRFARTIERIQSIIVSELTKIAIIHLYSQGYKNKDLLDFELSLTNPSVIHEEMKIELWNAKVSLANDMMDTNLLSSDFVYEQIFKLNDIDSDKERAGVIKDKKRMFRMETIANNGTDPADAKSEPEGGDNEDDGFSWDGDDDDVEENVSSSSDDNRKAKKSKIDTTLGVDDMKDAHKYDKDVISHKYKGGSALSLEGTVADVFGEDDEKIEKNQALTEKRIKDKFGFLERLEATLTYAKEESEKALIKEVLKSEKDKIMLK